MVLQHAILKALQQALASVQGMDHGRRKRPVHAIMAESTGIHMSGSDLPGVGVMGGEAGHMGLLDFPATGAQVVGPH